MTKDKLNELLKLAQETVEEAGEELMKHYGRVEFEAKNDSGIEFFDVVTKLDKQTEQLIYDRFKAHDSSIGFIGEELGTRSNAGITWLVDPIDGTAHFIRGLPYCTTMISLVENGEVVLAVIYHFATKNMYWAIKGQGAFLNGKKISVSDRHLSQAMVAIETDMSKPENVEKFLELRRAAGSVASFIGSGYELSLVSSGQMDGKITKDPFGLDWDYAPGSLLIQEAGGVVANLGKESYDYKKHSFIAANKNTFKDLTTGSEALFPLD